VWSGHAGQSRGSSPVAKSVLSFRCQLVRVRTHMHVGPSFHSSKVTADATIVRRRYIRDGNTVVTTEFHRPGLYIPMTRGFVSLGF
jgi:hypothetical protein